MKCSRCEKEAVTRTRGEDFCEECYHEFLTKKLRAHMGPFRVIGASVGLPPTILVSLSFGACSIALVDLLVDMQKVQDKQYNGRIGFRIECVYFGDEDPAILDNWPWPEIELKCLPNLPLPDDEASKQRSRSSLHDIEFLLLRKSALHYAHELKATAAFGYSMTRLSELTLSETVKGRGSSIPAIVNPSLEKHGVLYPLKDITLPELHEHCRIRGLDGLIKPDSPTPGITKMQSIDEIVRHYFADVRRDFPSVVSTVSKVASRLSQEPDPRIFDETELSPTEMSYACISAFDAPKLSTSKQVLKEYEL